MAAVDDFELVVETYHQALGEIIKGNPEGYKELYSHRDDVTLANPFGPAARGWEQVAATMERAASQFRDGAIRGQGRGKGGRHSGRPAGHEHLPARRGHMEGCASARGPHNHGSASRVGDTGGDLHP